MTLITHESRFDILKTFRQRNKNEIEPFYDLVKSRNYRNDNFNACNREARI